MPSTLIIVNGTTRVMETDIPVFIRSVMACAAETVKEAGCVYYYTGRDLIQPDLFRLSEGWTDQASLDAHLQTPHFARTMKEMAELTLTEVNLKRFHVTGEEDLSDLVPRKT